MDNFLQGINYKYIVIARENILWQKTRLVKLVMLFPLEVEE